MNTGKNRIQMKDSALDAVTKMVDGNFGAMEALMLLLQSDHVDPDNVLGGIGVILFLDTLQIYGTDIYVLYSDICGKDIVKMIAVLRAVQMGWSSAPLLKEACSRQDYAGRELIPVDSLYIKVKRELPNFDTK
ncbi:MAG: hypothetical protein ABIP27_16750 [Flavobacterium circumlabens]|uniref:hypothetical protein n=1 Tax=Flavobacterium circumlabens TaxID=2133765 RepID=UPI0032678428